MKCHHSRGHCPPKDTCLPASYDYDSRGYDWQGYNHYGFNPAGIHRDTGTRYGPDGYDLYGYDRDGRDQEGFDRDGRDREGRDRDGFDRSGFDREGYGRDGYDRSGLDRNGQPRPEEPRSFMSEAGMWRERYIGRGITEDRAKCLNEGGVEFKHDEVPYLEASCCRYPGQKWACAPTETGEAECEENGGMMSSYGGIGPCCLYPE